jgi:cytochrome P450
MNRQTGEAVVREAPNFDFHFVEHEFNRDPYPTLEHIRELGPVVYNLSAPDAYMVPGFADSRAVLADPQRFSQPIEFFLELFGGMVFEAYDTPRHNEIRSVWANVFRRDSLSTCRGELVARVVSQQLEPFVERLLSGEVVDAVPALTRPIPTLVVAEMLGVDPSMHSDFSSWSDAMAGLREGTADPTPAGPAKVRAATEATAALNAYMSERVKAAPETGDDLLTMMVRSEVGATMPPEELVANNTQLVFAGNETTSKLMGHVLVVLAAHPDQRRELVQDRSLIPQAIEEIHRYATVAQTGHKRVTGGDAVIADVLVPEGSIVQLLAGAANRDPTRWSVPETFDIHRERKQHIGFGFGMHTCLGLNLTRLEVQIFLDRLLDVLPEWKVAGDVDYGRGFFIRGPIVLPLGAG